MCTRNDFIKICNIASRGAAVEMQALSDASEQSRTEPLHPAPVHGAARSELWGVVVSKASWVRQDAATQQLCSPQVLEFTLVKGNRSLPNDSNSGPRSAQGLTVCGMPGKSGAPAAAPVAAELRSASDL